MNAVLDILKKYENPRQLDADQDKMYCVRFYMMAVEGKYPIERVKKWPEVLQWRSTFCQKIMRIGND